jgi:hypothetical protein
MAQPVTGKSLILHQTKERSDVTALAVTFASFRRCVVVCGRDILF